MPIWQKVFRKENTMNIQNQVTLVGYVATDPRFKQPSGEETAELFYLLAVNRNYLNRQGTYDVDFIPINVYGKQAITMKEHIEKGTLLVVSGSLQMTKWQEGRKATMYLYQQGYRRFNTNRSERVEPSLSNEDPFETLEPIDYLENVFND